MKKALLICAAMSMASTSAWAVQQSCSNPVGVWKNQLGSTLTITSVSSGGLVSGTYISPSGTQGDAYPLTGWTNTASPQSNGDHADLITFTVRWGGIGSITSWSGVCKQVNSVPTITAPWYLTRSNSQYSWDHTLAGQDVFTPSVHN